MNESLLILNYLSVQRRMSNNVERYNEAKRCPSL